MSSYRDLFSGLIPALLVGVLGGLGTYVAVKIDIAVLVANQDFIKRDVTIMRKDMEAVKEISVRVSSLERKGDLLDYQVGELLEGKYASKVLYMDSTKK